MESISAGAMWLLGIETFFMFALPVILLIVWKKKTQCRLMPALAGAFVFLVFSQLLEQGFHYLVLANLGAVSAAINQNSWLYILYVTLAAGAFEETGRYIAFRFMLKEDTDKPAAITYGIGHGGAEMIVLVGLTLLGYMVTGLRINEAGFAALTAGLPPEQMDSLRVILAQINTSAASDAIWAMLERLIAMALHLSLSVLVFVAARDPRRRKLYPIAIGLHALCNIPAGLMQRGILTQVWQAELIAFLLVAGVAHYAVKLYRTYKPCPVVLLPLR